MDILYQIQRPDFQFHYAETAVPTSKAGAKHCHFLYEAYLFLEGDMQYNVGTQSYTLCPFDMLLIPPSTFHYGTPKSDRVYRRSVLLFSETLLPPPLKPSIRSTPLLLHLGADHKIVRLFENLSDYARDCTDEEISVVASYYAAEFALLVKHYTRQLPDEKLTKDDPPPLMARTVAYINDHITEELNLDLLAAALYVTKFHLSHVFKETFGVGVIEFIRRKKLAHARLLISAGVKPQKACEMTGFKNYTTFYRMYKSHYSCAPSKGKG